MASLSTNETRPSWRTQSSTRLVMDPSGVWFVQRESLTPIDPRQQLEKIVRELGWLTPMLAKDTYVFFKGADIVVMKILTEIPFRIEMVVQAQAGDSKGKGKQVVYLPAFNCVGIQTDPPFSYRAPSDTNLIFAVSVQSNSSFLIMQDKADGALYHPIVPNVFENGMLCVGEDFECPMYYTADGLQEFLLTYLSEWSETEWNTDLLGTHGTDPRGWLKFDEKTKTNILPEEPGAWKSFCGGSRIVPPAEIEEAMTVLHERLTAPAGGGLL